MSDIENLDEDKVDRNDYLKFMRDKVMKTSDLYDIKSDVLNFVVWMF